MTNFKTVDLLLAGLTRVKSDYDSFVYRTNDRFDAKLVGDGISLETGEMDVTSVSYDFASDIFTFIAGYNILFTATSDDHEVIDTLLSVDSKGM